jgi:hypothetical protein
MLGGASPPYIRGIEMVWMKNPRTGKEGEEIDKNMNVVARDGKVSFGIHTPGDPFPRGSSIIWIHLGPGEVVDIPEYFVPKAKVFGLVELEKKQVKELIEEKKKVEVEEEKKATISREEAKNVLDQNTPTVKRIIGDSKFTGADLKIIYGEEVKGRKRVSLISHLESLMSE